MHRATNKINKHERDFFLIVYLYMLFDVRQCSPHNHILLIDERAKTVTIRDAKPRIKKNARNMTMVFIVEIDVNNGKQVNKNNIIHFLFIF